MHWILQNNLFNEAAYQTLVYTLEQMQLPYSIHKVIPFIGELTEPEAPTVVGPVICMGSYSLRHVAKKHGWQPGVFDLEPFNFQVQLSKWGNHMLNADSVVTPFKDAEFPFFSFCSAHQSADSDCSTCKTGAYIENMFIRPIEDSKVFAGKVFSREEFNEWKHKVVALGEDYGNFLTGDTLIQLCLPKVIYAEYRFWVVAGRIVCASLYKRGDKVMYSDEVDDRFFYYVADRISEWQPHDAFVIDVCDTPEGMKIVEINTLNSSGFYAADIQKLVRALERSFGSCTRCGGTRSDPVIPFIGVELSSDECKRCEGSGSEPVISSK